VVVGEVLEQLGGAADFGEGGRLARGRVFGDRLEMGGGGCLARGWERTLAADFGEGEGLARGRVLGEESGDEGDFDEGLELPERPPR
jgi:hypothetical protein